ncbi:MAG: glycine cleavage system protein H [Bdellovibrionota bacterium]
MSDGAPSGGEYLGGRLWFELKNTVVILGVTDFVIEQIGSVESVEFPDEGQDFNKGDVIATLEGSNGSFEVTAPASGAIQEINEAVRFEPERVSEDPTDEGWLVKFRIKDTTDLKEYI